MDKAVVAVAVSGVWSEPGAARPVDEPATRACPDLQAWLSAMSHQDRLGLQGRLETQILFGDPVIVVGEHKGWAQVQAVDQPSRKAAQGYPGWVRAQHLAPVSQEEPPWATVSARLTTARLTKAQVPAGGTEETTAGTPFVLSAGTRLPLLETRQRFSLLRAPVGGTVAVANRDLAPPAPAGEDLLAYARTFTGLAYLWGGCSGYGLDCSGLAHLVHRVASLSIPRDADDQAVAGLAVPAEQAAPGDLLFFAHPGQCEAHHVALCAGPGRMLHSPRTGRNVEEEDQAVEPYASERMRQARRYSANGPTGGPAMVKI